MNRIWPRLRFALNARSRTASHRHLPGTATNTSLTSATPSPAMSSIGPKTPGAGPNGAAAAAILTDQPAPAILENGNNPTTISSASASRPPPPPDPLQSATYFAAYDSLAALCANNIAYYAADQSDTAQRSRAAFAALADHLATARQMADTIRQFAPEYDFDAWTRGNGYRSFLLVVRSCVAHSLQLSTYVMQNRGSLLFRRQLYVKEIEAASQLMASLGTCLRHLLTLRDWSAPGSLFPRDAHSAAELFDTAASIDQYSFYGRCLGIQYCESMQSVVRVLAVAMAAFSEAYYKEGTAWRRTTASVWTSGKYYVNPELRARRIVNISQQAEIEFCKSFWSLTEGELMHALPTVLGTAVRVNVVVAVPAEPLRLRLKAPPGADGAAEMIDIPVPSSHLGAGVNTIAARLLSASRRRGMMGAAAAATAAADYKSPAKEPADAIIVHCHGGGFVAQSSKSHEMYLRDWAVALDVPIFSIDYSLAPAAPFPRAVEEVFYAYCWALHNCELLGTRAKRVVLAGDSAGANLCLATAIRCIEAGVRVPDGIFLAYCPVRISFDPSPARLLCLMDPLLPFGFMMRCLKAYACPNATIIAENRERVAEMERVRGAQGPGTVDGGGLKRSDTMQSVSLEAAAAAAFVEVGAAAEEASVGSPLEGGGSSLWEHIENDFAEQERERSSMAAGGCGAEDDGDEDGASDTFASASLRSQSSGGGNTDMMTPDESNGESLEEDSQPITLHPSMRNGGAAEENGNSATKSSPSNGARLEDDDEELVVLERPAVKVAAAAAAVTPSIAVPGTTRGEEAIVLSAGRDALSVQNIQQKIIQVMDSVATSVTARLAAMTASTPIRECQEFARVRQQLDAEEARDPTEEFVFEIPRDPLLSPYWASDEVLVQMPQTHILTVDMDPCLDDCVMFAKRLKELGRPVEMDILAGLPHGFLNFVKLSKEAHAGNKVCVKRLAQLLNVPDTSA